MPHCDLTQTACWTDLEEDTQVVALFCVEKEPEACHRSLVADKLAKELKLEVENIVP